MDDALMLQFGWNEPIDPEVRDVIAGLNGLGFLETLFSCAGHGLSSRTGKIHQKSNLPYAVVRYPVLTDEAVQFHYRLGQIADHTSWFEDHEAYGYYFMHPCPPSRWRRADFHDFHQDQWRKVGELVEQWSQLRTVVG